METHPVEGPDAAASGPSAVSGAHPGVRWEALVRPSANRVYDDELAREPEALGRTEQTLDALLRDVAGPAARPDLAAGDRHP